MKGYQYLIIVLCSSLLLIGIFIAGFYSGTTYTAFQATQNSINECWRPAYLDEIETFNKPKYESIPYFNYTNTINLTEVK